MYVRDFYITLHTNISNSHYLFLEISEGSNLIFAFNIQYIAPDYLPVAYEGLPTPPSHRQAVINAFVFVHQTLHQTNQRVARRGGRTMAITPRHYLDFINHYVSTETGKVTI